MKPTNIAFACYPIASLKKSRPFYEDILGLKATKEWVSDDTNGMIEYDIGPTTLAIGAGAENFPIGDGGAVVAIEISDLDDTIKTLKEKGCTLMIEKTETPICSMAVILDPDDNKIMLHQRKTS